MAKLTEYTSLEEKQQFYGDNCYNVIDTTSQLQTELGALLKTKHLLFRGMNEAKYKLFTSGQREYIHHEYTKAGIRYHDFMQSLLDNVDADIDLKEYNRTVNIKTNDSYYFTYLQHYGAYSPYIDYSTDLHMALFFSILDMHQQPSDRDIDNYFSLYYIAQSDIPFIRDIYKALFLGMNADSRGISLDLNVLLEMRLFYVSWEKHYGKFGNHYFLYRMPNRNMLAQKGVLIFNASDSKPLEEVDILKGKIHCMDIHKSLWQKMQAMYLQGVTKDRLFPCEYHVAKQAYVKFQKEFI